MAVFLGVGLATGGVAWASPSDAVDTPDSDRPGRSETAGPAQRSTAERSGDAAPGQDTSDARGTDRSRNRSVFSSARLPRPSAALNDDETAAARRAPIASTLLAQFAPDQAVKVTSLPVDVVIAQSAATGATSRVPAAVSGVEPTRAAAPVMSSASRQPGTASGMVQTVVAGLLGTDPQSPFGWAMLAVARSQIGRYRRGGGQVAAGAATATFPAAPAAGGPPATPPPFAENEVLLAWNPGSTKFGRALAMAKVNATVTERLGTLEMLQTDQGVVYRLKVPGGTEAAIQALAKHPAVAFVEPNYWVTADYLVTVDAASNDPSYTNGSLWGMSSDDSPVAYGPSGTTNQYGSGAEEAWGQGITGSRDIVVGIIDEGIQITHPELAANIWTNPGEVAGDGIDNDRNGYIDDVNGWDFYHDDNSVYDLGEDAHGTHVAGTIGAAGGNGTGVAGVCWEVTLVPAKFLGPQGGYISDAVDALNYLTDLKARYGVDVVAVNNSWGGGSYSSAMHGAILRAAKADILFVAAAGNSSANNDKKASYPSNYSSRQGTPTESAASYESVIAVASITSTGAMSSFSNYGATTVDIGAPGSSIISTVPTDSYANYNGTSMATPHVTGALALYASQNPTMSASALRSAILGNAKPTTSLTGKTVTGGRLSLEGLFGAVTAPTVSISPTSVTVAEGDSGTTAAQFTVSLSSASQNPVTVNYATANGSATAGQDYTATSGTLTFAPGQTSQQVSVNVTGDTAVEADETFTVSLSSPSGALLGPVKIATATIVNDDLPVVSISPATLTAVEGDSGTTAAQFTVSLSSASAAPVTVNYTTANGSATAGQDYTAASGALTFAAGETSKQITVNVTGDTAVESDETFTVTLSSPSGATLGSATSTATITNDDFSQIPPSVSISPVGVSVAEGNSGTTALQFTVSLSEASATPVTVNYATADGSATAGQDYAAASGTLTFAPGQTSQQVSINVIGDTTIESDETLTVSLSAPSGAVLGSATTSTVTIVNDDAAAVLPTVSISPANVSVAEGNSGTKAVLLTVSLSSASAAPVTVRYATANGSAKSGQDYTATSGTVTFAAGQTTAQISVNVIGDTAVETDETFTVTLSSPSGATLGSAKSTVKITNDDLKAAAAASIAALDGTALDDTAHTSRSVRSATSKIARTTRTWSTRDGIAKRPWFL